MNVVHEEGGLRDAGIFLQPQAVEVGDVRDSELGQRNDELLPRSGSERTDAHRGLPGSVAQGDDIQCLPAGGAAMDPEIQALVRVGGQGGVLQVQRLEAIGRDCDCAGSGVYRGRAAGVD